jgi:hypothetical protein
LLLYDPGYSLPDKPLKELKVHLLALDVCDTGDGCQRPASTRQQGNCVHKPTLAYAGQTSGSRLADETTFSMKHLQDTLMQGLAGKVCWLNFL